MCHKYLWTITAISESSVYFPWYWFVKYKTNTCIPDVFCRQTNSEMVWEIYTPILYNSEWTSAMNASTYDTDNILSIKIVMHVARNWKSCRVSSVTYITKSVTTIENLCIQYTFICCIGSITVYTGIRVVALAALSSLAALGVVTPTSPGRWRRRGCRRRGLLFRCFIFVCILIEPVILSLGTALENWWYLYVYMHTCMCDMSYPSTTFLLCT